MNTVLFLKQQYKCGGNHPRMLIFDELAQHSIGADDTRAFFDSIIISEMSQKS